MENTGSFGASIGGSSALKEAMARRGMGVGTMQQMSPGSVSGGVPMPQGVEMQAAQAALPQTQVQPSQPDSDVTIATKALATIVTNDSKMKRDLAMMQGQKLI